MSDRDLTADRIEQLAGLVRVEIGASRRERLRADLATILDHFRLLEEVDTSGVEPTFHPLAEEGELRPDAVEAGLTVEAVRGMAGPAFDERERAFVFQGVFASPTE